MTNASRGTFFHQLDRLYRDGTLSGLGDAQLLERYLFARDEAAFEALVKLHGPMVLGLCRRVLRDPRDIEDAFQATFLILIRKAATIRDGGHLSNWLYGVAYRVASRARTDTIRRRVRESSVGDMTAMPVSEIDVLGIGPELDQELTRLPAKYRAPLVMCYLNGRTHEQAAAELGCPLGTVRSRLSRGRDLLRRRLTSRGYPPTAAILSPTTSLPAQLLSEAVPSSLVSTTIETAVRLASFKGLQAGAVSVSVLALTQGVLTTMKLAQFKWIGLTLLATSLSAGGVIAVSHASATASREGPQSDSSAIFAAEPGGLTDPQTKTETTTQASNEDRLKSVERKIDMLLRRLGPYTDPLIEAAQRDPFKSDGSTSPSNITTATPNPTRVTAETPAADPTIAVPATTRTTTRRPTSSEPAQRAIHELETVYALAHENYKRIAQLFKNHAISAGQLEQVHGEVLRAKAGIEDLDDELADEIERAKLAVEKQKAELDEAEAQTTVAAAVCERNARLNQRKPGMVDATEVTKANAEMQRARAHARFKQVELAEAELRLGQQQRRRGRVKQILKMLPDGQSSDPAPAIDRGDARRGR
jgi:RNA polymerase sigma factor (sigma-70 family)